MTFAERLKQRRNELGLTQAELAKKAELTLPQFRKRTEDGRKRPAAVVR